jgi:hypothetical protein
MSDNDTGDSATTKGAGIGSIDAIDLSELKRLFSSSVNKASNPAVDRGMSMRNPDCSSRIRNAAASGYWVTSPPPCTQIRRPLRLERGSRCIGLGKTWAPAETGRDEVMTLSRGPDPPAASSVSLSSISVSDQFMTPTSGMIRRLTPDGMPRYGTATQPRCVHGLRRHPWAS